MNLKNKCKFIGLGNYGGKQVKEFHLLDYKVIAANGSEQDLKVLGDIPKYHLNGFDGFGGDREKALACLEQNPEFLRFMSNIDEEIIFLVFSGGGSFGSGCATILAEMLAQNTNEEGIPSKIICPVIALPSIDEAIKKQKNTYDAVKELQEISESGIRLGAAFFINNNFSICDSAHKEKDYQYINNTFAKFLDTFLSNDTYGELNNFDEAERLEMLKNNGMMVINLMGVKEKDQTLDQAFMLQRLTRDGIFAPVEQNMICENIAIIHAGRDNSDIEKDVIIAEVGKPTNVFEGYNGRSTLVAISGLNYPVSYISRLGESVKASCEERWRNKRLAKKLDDLDLTETEPHKLPVIRERKPTKWDVLQKKMNI